MIKKILSLSLIFSVLFFLSACNQSFTLNEAIINQNITHTYIEQDLNDISIKRVSFTDAQYSAFGNFTLEYQNQGLVVLTNINGEKAVYSIFEEKFLVDFADQEISIRVYSASGAYIIVTYPDEQKSVYDIKGTRIVSKDEYHTLEVIGYYEQIKDENDCIIGFENREKVTTLTKTVYLNGTFTPTIKEYIVDFNTNTRTPLEDQEDDGYVIGDKLGLETLDPYSLKVSGLDGYYATYIDNDYRIYNEDFELVSHFRRPTGSTITASLTFNGTILYQSQTKVPETEEDYTFINNNQKYILKTYALDMLTGETKEIDFNYAIFSMRYLKDENQVNRYAKVSAHPIESRILQVDALTHFIINSDGRIMDDYDPILDDQLIRLDESTIYNQTTNTIHNNDLNPLFKISLDAVIDQQEKLIITKHDNKLGVVNYQGEILIPFEFIIINHVFYNGYAMAYNATNDPVIIGIDGSEVGLIIYNTFLIPGVYIPFSSTNDYVFYDYQMNELFSFNSKATSITKHQISHPLIRGYILDFNKSGAYEYVVIEYN